MKKELLGKRIAVTGGAGFIGSHLVDKLLDQGKEVVVFDDFSSGARENLEHHRKDPRVTVLEGDVRDRVALERAFRGVDLVFHLATVCVRLSLTDPVTNHEVNATGTLNTLLAAKACGVSRYIYCSSSEVYGNASRSGELLSEDSMESANHGLRRFEVGGRTLHPVVSSDLWSPRDGGASLQRLWPPRPFCRAVW